MAHSETIGRGSNTGYLDILDLQTGLYFLTIWDGKTQVVERFVKN